MRRGKKDATQQLVIPRGVLGPGEAAVVEIPRRYQKSPIIVLKRKPGEMAQMRADNYFVPASKEPPNIQKILTGQTFSIPTTSHQPTVDVRYTAPQQIIQQPVTAHQIFPQQVSTPQVVVPTQTSTWYNSPPYFPQTQCQAQPSVVQQQPVHFHPTSMEMPYQQPYNIFCEKERCEAEMYRRSLDEFQKARRKFLRNAKALNARLSATSDSSSDG